MKNLVLMRKEGYVANDNWTPYLHQAFYNYLFFKNSNFKSSKFSKAYGSATSTYTHSSVTLVLVFPVFVGTARLGEGIWFSCCFEMLDDHFLAMPD